MMHSPAVAGTAVWNHDDHPPRRYDSPALTPTHAAVWLSFGTATTVRRVVKDVTSLAFSSLLGSAPVYPLALLVFTWVST